MGQEQSTLLVKQCIFDLNKDEVIDCDSLFGQDEIFSLFNSDDIKRISSVNLANLIDKVFSLFYIIIIL